MLTIQKVDLNDRAQVDRFVRFPYRHYAECEYWVPPLFVDAYLPLNPKKHPFYDHSDLEFYLAVRNGRDVGRVAAIENRPFNEYHQTKKAQLYFFECENEQETANALFEQVFSFARERGLDTIMGPKGIGPLDGYGILVNGFDQRQMMTMMNYNYAYYPSLFENAGFEKEVDFVSCYLPANAFDIPERVVRIAERVLKRGNLSVKRFKSKRELIQWASRIGQTYNQAFVANWEYYPLSQREIDFVVDNIMTVADHRLIKIILHDQDVVGFLFGFPDLSAALQRARGKLFPLGLPDLLLEMKRTQWISGNGMGILPEHQGLGGNAVLYYEMGKTIKEMTQFKHVEMTQVAETAEQMRADLKNLNGIEYKNHRVYRKRL